MNFIIWIVIFIIVIFLIIIICVVFIPSKNNKVNTIRSYIYSNFKNNDIEIMFDSLVHFSADKQNLVKILTDIKEYDFISLTDILTGYNQYNYLSGINNKPNIIISYNSTQNTFNNDNTNILQGYTELKHLSNYNAVSLKHSFPIDKLVYITGDGLYCYLRKYIRLIDNKNYVFVQIKIDYNQDEQKMFLMLSSLLEYLKTNFNNDFIITGNFNIHGHEAVFKNFFSESDYFICPMYKTITVNNIANGLVAFDGLVVSKNLYKSIEYRVDFYNSDTDRYILYANMYYTGSYTLTDVSDYKFKNYVKNLSKLNLNNNYINNVGKYDSNVNKPNVSLISEKDPTAITSGHYQIYSNNVMNKKLETIETIET